MNLSAEQLRELPDQNGKSLADHVATVIGNIGENLILRRATCFKAGEKMLLSGYAHPAPSSSGFTMLGKYGAIIAFKEDATLDRKMEDGLSLEQFGRQLCQHVVGKCFSSYRYVVGIILDILR